MQLEEAVREFLSILEETEESESGRKFHPTTINSCRCLKMERVSELLQEMKRLVKEKKMCKKYDDDRISQMHVQCRICAENQNQRQQEVNEGKQRTPSAWACSIDCHFWNTLTPLQQQATPSIDWC